jgi:hemolysin activation/secretion protein
MITVNFRRLPSLWVAFGVLSTLDVARAQSGLTSGSQLPPGEGVPRKTAPAELDLRLGGTLNAPEGAASILLMLEALEIEGGLSVLEEQTRALVPATGSTLTLEQIYETATRLQAAYLDAGYPLVRVFVPVQEVDQARARIRIRVVSGFIGEIDASGVPERVRRPVLALTRRLQDRPALTASELERAVLLAGEVAGVTLRSTLMAGRIDGETRLILSADHRLIQTATSFDNRLADDLGGDQLTLSMGLNGLMGRGDRAGVTLASALSDVRLSEGATRRYIGLFADTLVGSSGLAIGADGAISSSRPGGPASLLGLQNEFRRAGLTLVYPSVRTRLRTANTRVSLDLVEEFQESDLLGFPVTLSRDRTRVVRVAHEDQWRVARGPFSGTGLGLDVEYSRGLDGLGARTAAEATPLVPLSRAGANAVFDKFVLGVWAASAIEPLGLVASIDLRGQTGFGEPLLRSEQFSVASVALISGLPSGAVVGDDALAGRVQLSRTIISSDSRITPYVFGAKAQVDLQQPTVLEAPTVRLDAYGAGVRGEHTFSSGLEVAFSIEWSRTDATQPDFDDDGIAVRVTFRL